MQAQLLIFAMLPAFVFVRVQARGSHRHAVVAARDIAECGQRAPFLRQEQLGRRDPLAVPSLEDDGGSETLVVTRLADHRCTETASRGGAIERNTSMRSSPVLLRRSLSWRRV